MNHRAFRPRALRPVVTHIAHACLLISLLSGCFSERVTSEGPSPLTADRLDLSAVAPAEDPAVGVTYDDSGQQFLLTRSGFLFEVTEGRFTLVHEINARIAPFGFTDIASVGPNRFAISSQSDGFLLDLSSGSFEQHFCYEPDWEEPAPGEPVMVQTSYALAFADGVIYAQPQTSPQEDPSSVDAAFFASYDLLTGQDLSWAETGSFRFVGGMAHITDGELGSRLLVGQGDRLSLVDVWSEDGTAYYSSLGRLGIDEPVQIEGMAVHPFLDEFAFIDSNSNELRTLSLSETLKAARERQAEIPLGS